MNDKEKKPDSGEDRSLPEGVELFDTIFREELVAEKEKLKKEKTLSRKGGAVGGPTSSQVMGRKTTTGAPGRRTREVVSTPPAQSQRLKRPAGAVPLKRKVITAEKRPAQKEDLTSEGLETAEGPSMPEQKVPKRSRSLKLLLVCILLILLAGAAFQYLVVEDFATLIGFFKEKEKAPPAPPPEVKQSVPPKMQSQRPAPPPAPPAKVQEAKPASPAQQDKSPTAETKPAISQDAQPATASAPTTARDKVPPKEAPAVAQDKKPPTAAPPVTKPAPPAPPAMPESRPQPQKAVAEPASAYPYSVYLGSYRDLKGAERAVSIYSSMGLSPFWTRVDLGEKGIWYRVFAGQFRTQGEAEAFIKERQIQGAEAQRRLPVASQGKTPAETSVPGMKPAGGGSRLQTQGASADAAPSYPYSIYLGSYQDLGRARAAASQYAEMGLSAYWTKVDLGEKGIWYRIFGGYFRTKGEADDLIKAKQIPDAEIKTIRYAILVGVYRTEADAGKVQSDLLRFGISSYMIKSEAGDFRLYEGAYYSKAWAEAGLSELASKGIQGQVVRR